MALAGWLALWLSASASAATLFETTQVLAANAEAAAQLPAAHEFTLSASGDYVVTLRDLGVPAALREPGDLATLQSLQALVIRDLQVVAQLDIDYPTSPAMAQLPATQTFAGTPGTYRVYVLGAIASGEAGGLFSVDVVPSAGGAAVFTAADAIATRNGPAPEQSVLQTTFTTVAAGTYQLSLTDRAFPSALVDRDVVLVRRRGTDVTAALLDVGTFTALDGDQYDLIVIATAGGGQAGSYGVSVTGGPSSAVIYRSENTVGQLPPAVTLNIASAGMHTLTLTDLQFPEALASFSAAVIQNGTFIGAASGATPANLTLSAGSTQLLVFASAGTTGALSVTLSQGTQVDYAEVHIVDASADATTPAIYSFKPSQTVSAGEYTLTLQDFRFPSQLPSVAAAVVQNATLVHRTVALGDELVTLQAGPVHVVVAATPPPVSGTIPGNGMFSLALKTRPGNAVVFESTQGVGGLFTARSVSLPTAGRYDVTLKDFEFPDTLRTSWLAITRGTALVGQVIGSSSIQNLQLEAGEHVLNFLGQPAANARYGTFGMKVADSVAPPVATLSVSPATITSGQTTTLQWSATNATSCTAAGGWSGTKSVSGTEQTATLTANTTFEIECVGPGGRDDASVTVTVNAASPGKRGGGGHMDAALLVMLLGVLLLARTRAFDSSLFALGLARYQVLPLIIRHGANELQRRADEVFHGGRLRKESAGRGDSTSST